MPSTPRRPHHPAAARLLALVTGGMLPLALLAAPASAARLPDLRVKGVTAPSSVERGATFVVRETTVNAGRGKAGRSRTAYYLSKDTRLGRKDRLLGARNVGVLKPRRKSAASTRLDLAASTPTGRWYVLACADAKKRVKESKEGNNCATSRPVTVASPSAPTFPLPPDPQSVESTVQTDRAVSAMFYSHEEQSLVATAEDGTTYTLEMPPGALLGPEEITMTPVAAVEGLPLSGGLVAGVQIEPHGLMLLKPARLTIQSPDAGPLGAQTGFLFHEGGADLHPYPMDAPEAGDDANVIRMTLNHFSTPGVGSGTPGDRSGMEAHVPAHVQSQVQAAIAGLLSQERANQLQGRDPDPAVAEQVERLMNQFHDDVVRPRMKAAETNEDLAAEAIALGLGWSRQVLLLGDEDNPRHAEITARVERIMRNVMNQNWADCLDHDLTAVRDLFRVARVAALMGYAWQQEALDKALGCGRFEIRIDSLVRTSSSWSGNLQNGSSSGMWHVESTVHTEPFNPDATGPITWRGFDYSWQNTITDPGSTCHMSETGVSTAPGRARAVAGPLVGSINPIEGADPSPPVPVINGGGVVPGHEPTETYRRTTCDGSESTHTDSRWVHAEQHFGQLWTTDPAQQSGDFIDAKTFTRTDDRPGSFLSETTTVEVWHKPQL